MIIQIFWIKQEINAKDETYLAITLISNLAFVVNCVMSYVTFDTFTKTSNCKF